MKVNNSLSSYPILHNYRRDYLDASFTSKMDLKDEFDNLVITLDFTLTNVPELETLIKEKKASYYIHVECTYTSFRKCFKTDKLHYTIKIPSNEISDKVEISTFIISDSAIKGYNSKKFNPLYKNMRFDINCFQIMAVGNSFEVKIKKDDTDLDSTESIIRYRRIEDNDQGIKVITDEDEYIIVGIPDKTFENVNLLGKETFPSSILSLAILLPMSIVLGRMHNAKDDELFREKHWYQVIETLLRRNNYSIDDLDIQSDDLMDILQKIFKNPIVKAIEELKEYSEEVNQDAC